MKEQRNLDVILQMLADVRRIEQAGNAGVSSSFAGPMPESISRCGEPTAPALRITSLSAKAVWT